MYAGLRSGADPDHVVAAARDAGAPFCAFDDYVAWVRQSIEALRREPA